MKFRRGVLIINQHTLSPQKINISLPIYPSPNDERVSLSGLFHRGGVHILFVDDVHLLHFFLLFLFLFLLVAIWKQQQQKQQQQQQQQSDDNDAFFCFCERVFTSSIFIIESTEHKEKTRDAVSHARASQRRR